MRRKLCLLLAVLCAFSCRPSPGRTEASPGGEAVPFYTFLRDQAAPEKGIAAGASFSVPAYRLADTLARQGTGLISAAVCDLNGDGAAELLTVTGEQVSDGYARYSLALTLYGPDPATGGVALWDTQGLVARVESETASGMLAAHIQRSEGTVYIICDASIENYTSSEWDYRTSRVFRVDGQRLTDLTDFEGFLRGSSGVSLHEPGDPATALCVLDLQWEQCAISDFTGLAEALADPSAARLYTPQTVDLADYRQAQGAESARVDLLVEDLERNVCPVVHVSTSAEGEEATRYVYDTGLGCRVTVVARKADGAILSVMLDDSGLYADFPYLRSIDAYLQTDMTEELKRLYFCVLTSRALELGQGEIAGLMAAELVGNVRSDQDRIVFHNRREETVGTVALEAEKAVYTAASGSNVSYVRLSLGQEAAAEAAQTPALPPQPTPEPREETLSAPAAGELPALGFGAVSLRGRQTFDVYAAPSTSAWRGANGKAKVDTGGPVLAAGRDGDWLLIFYEISAKAGRVGYMDLRKVQGALPEAEALAWAWRPATLVSAATLTDDPLLGMAAVRKLKKGEKVTLLATFANWAYVETTVDGKTARGFLPLSALSY